MGRGALAIAALLALAPPAAQGRTARERLVICGARHAARSVPVGARVPVRGRVDRCKGGRWKPVRRLDTTADGDYRIRARGGTRYVRVGVGEIVDEPVAFTVRNINRTPAPCQADGREYDVRGDMVAPRAALLDSKRTVALYLHAAATNHKHIWRQRLVPGYDHLFEMARLGHVSVAIDFLGYGASGLPNGLDVCLGSEADVVHQVVTKLRTEGFGRVALVTQSVGGLAGEIEAYTFGDVDSLVLGGFGFDELATPAVLFGPAARGAPQAFPTCALGGQPKHAGAPRGYADFFIGLQPADVYLDAEPAIVAAHFSTASERDACGLGLSLVPAIAVDRQHVADIHGPVLLISGAEDRFFPPSAMRAERDLFTGSNDVRLVFVEHAGHHPMLERRAPAYRAVVSDWLRAHGF